MKSLLGGILMFQIHYCEFSRQNDASDIIFRPNGSGDWLFLLFLAPMQVTFPDRTEIAQAGSCLLYSPQDYQNYHAVKNSETAIFIFPVRRKCSVDTACRKAGFFTPLPRISSTVSSKPFRRNISIETPTERKCATCCCVSC